MTDPEPLTPLTPIHYTKTNELFFCNRAGQYFTQKECNGRTELVPPKKAIVYNKPGNIISKKERTRWLSKHKYR